MAKSNSSAFQGEKHTASPEYYCGPIDMQDFQQGGAPLTGDKEQTYTKGTQAPK